MLIKYNIGYLLMFIKIIKYSLLTCHFHIREDSPLLILNYFLSDDQVLAYFGRTWTSPFFLALINREVELREQLYKTSSAGNWLFYGIDDSLLDLIVPLRDLAEIPLPFDKFAWFFGRNQSSTAEGRFTLFTGSDDLSKVGKINLWKGMNRTDAYDGVCGEVGGTTGEVLPPMKNPTTVSVFSADVCR